MASATLVGRLPHGRGGGEMMYVPVQHVFPGSGVVVELALVAVMSINEFQRLAISYPVILRLRGGFWQKEGLVNYKKKHSQQGGWNPCWSRVSPRRQGKRMELKSQTLVPVARFAKTLMDVA